MPEQENDFSIYLSKNGCKLGIGSNLFLLTEGTDAGDRKSYSYKDEKGVDYRISLFKNERRFGNLFVDDSNNYLGAGIKEVVIPRNKQFIEDF